MIQAIVPELIYHPQHLPALSNSGSESWTGIGVVAGFGAVVLIVEESHVNKGDAT